MGLFDKFRQNLPGGPTSVAKTMLNAYRKYIEFHPDCPKAESLRFAIESRYRIIKALDKDRIEWIIERSDCLETMVFLTFCCENNLIDKITDEPHPVIIQIEKDITEFFQKEAPEESAYSYDE